MRIRPIHHTFGPHVTRRFALRTDRLLLQFWAWNRPQAREELRMRLQEKFHSPVALFASGREALLALLRSLHFEQGAEILIQGYTCVAVPNAIHAAGYTPVYVDIDRETLNMDPNALRGRITKRTRAVICQHTFGIPSDTKQLKQLCSEQGVLLIEDAAHMLPDEEGPDGVGVHGDYLFTSFGRDKAISGITGGAVIARNPAAKHALREEEEKAVPLSRLTVLRLLLYAPLYHKSRMVYGLGIGKAALALSSKLKLLVPVLNPQEKTGDMPPLLHALPAPCAALAAEELTALSDINAHRRSLTSQYLRAAEKGGWSVPAGVKENLPLQKFPLFVKDPDRLRTALKKEQIYLDDGWTGAVVCPRTVRQESTNYIAGSCPHAEWVARSVLSLPTHPTMTQKQTNALLLKLHSLLA